MSGGMPSMYRCIVCDLPIRPQDSTTCRLAVVWLKAKGTTISRVHEELHSYKHEFCDERKLDEAMQPSLF
jgi:hypothetical protein